MTSVITKTDSSQPATETAVHLFDNWFDPIESGLRERVREFIEELIRGELDAVLEGRATGGGRKALRSPMLPPLARRATGMGAGRAR